MLPGVLPVEADIHDDATLARLVGGADAVINLVAQLHGSEAAFDRVHVALPRRLAAACRAAGVRRVVHVSALGVAANAPSRYLRSKAAGEEALRGAGLDLTLLRPSVIFGAEDRLLNLFAKLQAVFPVMPLAGADSRYQPVWVEDVARAIVLCLDRRETIGQVIECTGPRTMTLRQIVELAGRLCGHPRPRDRTAGRARAAAGAGARGDARRAADVARQPRFDDGGQRRDAASIRAWPRWASARRTSSRSRRPSSARGEGIARLDTWRSRHS